MPRQIDLFPNHLQVDHNPLNQLSATPLQFQNLINTLTNIPALTLQAIEEGINQLLTYIDQVTGLDLAGWAKTLEGLFGTGSLLTNFTNNIPFIGQLISMFTGATGGLTGLGGLTSIFSDLTGLLGNPTGLGSGSPALPVVGSIPLLGPLINEFITMLAGGGSGLTGVSGLTSTFSDLLGLLGHPTSLGTGSPVLPAVGSIPILGPLINELITLFAGTGSGLTGLTSVFSDFLGLLGHPTGLGTGAASTTLPSSVLQPLINAISQGFGGSTGLGFSGLESLLAAIPGVGPLLNAIFGGLGGTGTGTTTLVQSMFGNLMSLLGGINLNPGGSFDPIASAEQVLSNVLTPAGALTTITQLPAHLFGALIPGVASTNLLPDPGFNNAAYFQAGGPFTQTTSWGHSSPLGAAITTATGQLLALLGVPIGTTASQETQMCTWTAWSGLTAATGQQSLSLLAAAYDAADNIIGTPTAVAAITNPPASSAGFTGNDAIRSLPLTTATGSDGRTWVQLTGKFTPPSGTTLVRQMFQVDHTVTAGSVAVDDACHTISGGLIDSVLLGNLANHPQIPGTSVAGFQNITTLLDTLTHTFDGLGTAFNLSMLSGVTPPQLFGLAQDMSQNAVLALEQAVTNTQILGKRTNKPLFHGLDPTSEVTVPVHSATTSTTVATGTSIIGHQRVFESATKGFVEFLAQRTSGTGVYTNTFSVNPTTGNKTALFNSADISSLISTSALGYVRSPISGTQPTVAPGDLIMHEIVNNTGANLTVLTNATGKPNNSNTTPTNLGGTRSIAGTGGTSPTSLTDSQITYSGTVPHINFGISAVRPDYHAPQTTIYSSGHGTFTFTLDTWLTTGDKADCVGVGGGGAGQGEKGYDTGSGAQAGQWNGITLTVGTDIAIGGTVTVTVGTGGPGTTGYFAAGANGTATTFSWTKPGVGTQTMTCAGGAGGGSFTWNPVGGTGQGSGDANYSYNSTPYYGGADVGGSANGTFPGGGGGGAAPFLFGGGGADGEAWITERQA